MIRMNLSPSSMTSGARGTKNATIAAQIYSHDSRDRRCQHGPAPKNSHTLRAPDVSRTLFF